jgi:hypothetical protein
MYLFSQVCQWEKFAESRAGTGCVDGSASDGVVPRLRAGREHDEREGVEFDDIGRRAARVAGAFSNLNSAKWWNADLDRFAGCNPCELLQNPPNSRCHRGAILDTRPNIVDRFSAGVVRYSGLGHALTLAGVKVGFGV